MSTSNALKIVNEEKKLVNEVAQPRKYKRSPEKIMAKARKSLRTEAAILHGCARMVTAIGLIAECVICSLCGAALSALGTAAAIALCIVGFAAGLGCIALSLVLFSISEMLKNESKKLK